MKYIPATIPADLARTRVGLLWAAANISVDEPASDDAITEAARRVGVVGEPAYRDAETLAVTLAQSRVPSARLNPLWPSTRWNTWQDALDEVWPILADAAAQAQGSGDLEIGLVPGRWEA